MSPKHEVSGFLIPTLFQHSQLRHRQTVTSGSEQTSKSLFFTTSARLSAGGFLTTSNNIHQK